jgi:Xaa-Pro aminopeptidase
LRRKGFFGVARWFEEVEAIWHKSRTEKSEKRFPSLLDRLNYNDLLVTQSLSKRYVVLYTATGTNLVSSVIDKQALPCFIVSGKEIKPKGFIVDVKTWFFETESEMEGYYLSANFNSGIINEMIKPLQPRGLFGARAIHRRPLTLPIPKFDNKNRLHLELADIGRKAHERIKTVEFTQKNNIRAEVREELKDEIARIDQIVSSFRDSHLT